MSRDMYTLRRVGEGPNCPLFKGVRIKDALCKDAVIASYSAVYRAD